ncbi:MAG: hypothetical protein RI560_05290 [Natronomonas sp.]|nr:hypothetical protein [Natronomonas sp.]MDR9381073.1 hypothetical protein [Natronomonas sp.]MDR9430827.1 hypothetical protein [Natronomonas sp.]
MSDVEHADNREEVEERVAVNIPDGSATGLLKRDGDVLGIRDCATVDRALPCQESLAFWTGDAVDVRRLVVV